MNAFLAIATMATLQLQSPTVLVDGKKVEFENGQPRVIGGRIMVPLRGVFEAIGAYVGYDDVNRVISAKMNNEIVEMRLGDKIARKNGAEIQLDVVPTVISGATYVPLRFLSESLGAKVDYDKANAQVSISTAN